MVLVLIPLFSLLQLGAGQWKVLGPKQTIQVWEGEDVTFPCSLSPETNAEAMEVRFFKDYFNAIVFLYQDGKDKRYMQMTQYKGRTELVKDFITNGRVLLKLQKVVPSDTGIYGCWFSSKTHQHEAIWDLEVTVLGSPPLISVMGYVDGGIQLLCQSSGWVSQPIMKWIGPDELELPSDSKVNEDTQGLFDVETSLTVQEDSGSVACSIQHTDHSRVVKSRIWIRKEVQDKLELKETWKFAEALTLDPDTAHPQLYISNLKRVTYKPIPQDVSELDTRFVGKCLVAHQGFLSGKHYWEVEVGHNNCWSLGVCQDSVDRKKLHVTLSPMNGYWVLEHEKEDFYFVNNPNRIRLYPRSNLTRVGIFLDYECGTLSFFNVDDESLIYTLTCRFKGLLRPYIQLNPHDEEKVSPIVIAPCHAK
ncbi:PREDICTED: butyrophilin-like protein 8 [Dipodomys ordii]|uniref:Butyrophilin-like protein 8 n=1 Tax=Dipodomys ordii TaxID=10020 RepID=A0A1S3GBY3_DIPOR|nr:PREDICTED: butyrophilin-like protein 8 [Dipodomys ordii]